MKKLLSAVICLSMLFSIVSLFPLCAHAEENGGGLPDFAYPMRSYKTFEETGLPYDEIISFFPETVELKHENGVLSIKNFGAYSVYVSFYSENDDVNGELKDGYWIFEVSADQLQHMSYISFNSEDGTWDASYDPDGSRDVVFFSNLHSCSIALYPSDGYGDRFVTVSYETADGLRVSDSYSDGVINSHIVTRRLEDSYIDTRYFTDGTVDEVFVTVYSTDEFVRFIPDMGWVNYVSETASFVPTDAPTGYEDATLEDLIAQTMTDINCEHRWLEPLCDTPSECALCHRYDGAPAGHSWTSINGGKRCDKCDGILYDTPAVGKLPTVTRPYYSFSELGIDVRSLIPKGFDKLHVKYENGILMFPCIEGSYFSAIDNEGHGIFSKVLNGWNCIEIDENRIRRTSFIYDCEIEEELELVLEYNGDGMLTDYSIDDSERDITISAAVDGSKISVSYDTVDKLSYDDTYKNGILDEQYVWNAKTRIGIEYDRDLNVNVVHAFTEEGFYHYFPGKGWSSDGYDYVAADTPEVFKDKDLQYFKEQCPTNVDFCIHSLKDVRWGTECTKCGEKNVTVPVGFIVGISVSAAAVIILAAVVTVIVIKKKKTSKS